MEHHYLDHTVRWMSDLELQNEWLLFNAIITGLLASWSATAVWVILLHVRVLIRSLDKARGPIDKTVFWYALGISGSWFVGGIALTTIAITQRTWEITNQSEPVPSVIYVSTACVVAVILFGLMHVHSASRLSHGWKVTCAALVSVLLVGSSFYAIRMTL